ncbi:hypothetical protein IWQ61_007808 [Dispira simplex]|nr:hypothetical protein IWQ61_007808 [Dispira simplex]
MTHRSLGRVSQGVRTHSDSTATALTTEEVVSGPLAQLGVSGTNIEKMILNVIRLACAETLQDPQFAAKLRRIKECFVERDYEGVFTDPENLPIYTSQYIPGRTLCYFQLFTQEAALFRLWKRRPRTFCMGAGAGSELVAMAAVSLFLASTTKGPLTCLIQDFVNWQPVLNSLENTIRDIWSIPTDHFQVQFTEANLLAVDQDLEIRIRQADLVTAMFVMNELFCICKKEAMTLVKTLIRCLRPGAYFLLVDSAGSFSHIQVGNNTYMLYTVFDSLKQHFKPVVADNARWYRYPTHLKYPLKLDNMQYYVRLYEKL